MNNAAEMYHHSAISFVYFHFRNSNISSLYVFSLFLFQSVLCTFSTCLFVQMLSKISGKIVLTSKKLDFLEFDEDNFSCDRECDVSQFTIIGTKYKTCLLLDATACPYIGKVVVGE